MAEPTPIRPDLPISVGSEAMRFCADAVAEFIAEHGDDPSSAVLILFDAENKPTISFTGATASNLCLVGALLQSHAVEQVTSARTDAASD